MSTTSTTHRQFTLHGFTLSDGLAHLSEEIQRSRSMLDLADDWDGEGSPGYRESTWNRAIGFLVTNATRLLDDCGVAAPAPEVLPGPNGSIDLHWRSPHRELLVNMPAAAAEPVRFYGDHGGGVFPIEGSLDLAAPSHWLRMWLAE